MELPLEDAIATKLIGDEGSPRLASRHWRRGFEIGDMVWGKVKSHPWWPGYIFSEAFAAPSVQRSKREGNILVAFYGDSSYGWLDPDDLVHFEPTFAEKSLQTNVKNFIEAVEEAVDEVMRRSALGLVCHCRKTYRLRAVPVNGFFAVDFSDLEWNCTYSASQIKKARKSFLPKETLVFVRKLALKPRSKVRQDLNFVKKKATALAYRKAVFEEDDPTYAEAFDITPSKQSQEVAQPFGQPSSRALLSGPSNNVKHTSSLKPQKNPAKPDDPTTKGERKRGSSGRQEEIAAKKKKKKINDMRALAAQKKASAKTSEVQPGDSKEIPAKKLVSTPVKSSKPGSGQKEPAEKVPDPAILVMKFPHNGSLPSVPELNAKFARFGALDHSATRVFCKSSTCRLVYQFRDHAVQAFRFATGSTNLFGNTNLRCYIRDRAAAGQDMETTKVPREDASSGISAPKDGEADSRSSAKPGQLKSCLKKPPGEEGPMTDGGNGSNSETPCVKFMLGADDNNKRNRGEQMNDTKNVNNSSSIADGSASSSSNIINYTTQSSILPLPTTAQYPNAPNDIHFAHQVAYRNVPNYNNQVSLPGADFSEYMLGLLTKCSDIVSNVRGLLGHFPYNAL